MTSSSYRKAKSSIRVRESMLLSFLRVVDSDVHQGRDMLTFWRRPATNISGGTLRGVIRGTSRGVVKSDTAYVAPFTNVYIGSSMTTEARNSAVPFRKYASGLGSYKPPAPTVSGNRRFSELPAQSASSFK
ncbi:G-patch domain-containing protein [Artemisia annua]|uniref:G-patch domain-containing protein n=1 Tax=Artemisia annua TaxID=35608 RepID=A0A2U1L9M5_ARTAN|nr:G-patch domain-containing protein [Artemisia annua]